MSIKQVIGREEELKKLTHAIKSRQSEFIAVYGRRRVGKTFLIHHYCTSFKHVYFHITGIRNGAYEEQLSAFINALSDVFYHGVKLKVPANWFDALDILTKSISKIRKNQKVILFLDEFPWMVTRRSRLLRALEYYWNHNLGI